MDCEQALEYISASLDGELNEQEELALAGHLAGCARCRALAAEFGALSAGVAALEADPPSDLPARIMAAMAQQPAARAEPEEREKTVPFPTPKQVGKFPRAAAAVLVAAVCLGGVLLWSGQGGTDSGSADNFVSSAAAEPYDLAPAAAEPESGSEESGGAERTAGAPDDTEQDEQPDKSSGAAAPIMDGMDTPEEPMFSDLPTQSPEPAAPEPAAPADASPPALTQDEALDLVFAHLGGYTVYPDATIEEAYGYALAEVAGNGGQGRRRLAFEAVSDNGSFYIFRLYDAFWSGGGERTVTVKRYAVSMDGGQVLEAGSSGYEEAVGQ